MTLRTDKALALAAVVCAVWTLVCLIDAGRWHAVLFSAATGGVLPSRRSWAMTSLGLWYALPVFAILLAHEGGHWLAARRVGIRTAGPFLVPGWYPPFIGTFGAYLWLRRPRTPTHAWTITLAGVLSGFVAAVLCLIVGLAWSVPVQGQAMAQLFHFSLIDWLSGGQVLAWHPLAVAGWVGLVLTWLSLLPVPMFDGWTLLRSGWQAWSEFSPAQRRSAAVPAALAVLCWV